MAKTKEKRKKKKNHSKSEEDKVYVKEKKISKKHKHISEKPEKKDKREKKSKKTKKKHKEYEKSEVPKSEIVAPHNPPSIPTLIAANDSDSGSEYDPVDLRQLLDSYSKEELVDLICTNAEKGCRLISAVHELADRDVSRRKIFVRGLGWDTTRESLETAFEPYGEIEECTVIMDKDTGRAKGYGFVLFKTRKGASKALKSPQKKMYNRTVICNLASERPPGVGKGREMVEQVKIDLTQMATATATATGTNHSEVSGFELGHGHVVNNAPQPDPRSALFAGQSMPFFGQPHGFNPMYGAMMGNQVVAGLPNYAVFGSGMMNQGLMVPPNQMGMMGQYAADGTSNGGGERAWYLRQ